MKRSTPWLIKLVLFFAFLGTATLPTAHAANREGQFSISPVIGGITFDGKQHLDTSPFFGIRGGYNFTDHLGVEALFDYARTGPTRGAGDVDFFRYGGELLYHFIPDGRLVPYLAAGYSGVNFSGAGGVTSSKTKGAFDYGAGLKYFITDRIALRGDLRHLIYSHKETLNAVEYSLGLYIPFGGTKVAAKSVEQPAAAPEPEKEAPPEAAPYREPEPGRYKYCITLNIDFEINKDLIRPEYHNEIAKVGDFMKKYETTTAVIEGHTDNVGTPEHNQELSGRRAGSVVNYLADHFGIERSRLTAKGFGSSRPVADNDSDAGRQKNRRIEAVIDCAFDVKEIKPPDMLCMTLKVEFDTDKADIKPEHQSEIAKVGEYMQKYPTTTALIEGHTDNIGGYQYNMKLSQRRAEGVLNYLVEKFGIDRSRLNAKGFGFTRRVAYNSTPEGRQQNRRINVIIDCVINK